MVDHNAVQAFRSLFLAHEPERKARMNAAGSCAKYSTFHHPISAAEIKAHLGGKLTLAAPLIGPSGLAYAAALDVDSGGRAALWQLLVHIQHRRFTAFAVSSETATHTGGHVWLLFDEPTAPERLRTLVCSYAAATGITAETYPSRKTIRLPLGVHRVTQRRGQLLLPNGTTIDLDQDPSLVTDALSLIAALPRNDVRQLPEPRPRPLVVAPGRSTCRGQRHSAATIRAYNLATDLLMLLESYGGRVAMQLAHGGALLHCPCAGHTHGDQRPSLEIRPARSVRYGRFVAFGYAPSCLFYTETGGVIDAFEAYCRLEQVSAAEALQRLSQTG